MAWTLQFGPDPFNGSANQQLPSYDALYVDLENGWNIDASSTYATARTNAVINLTHNTTTLAADQAIEATVVQGSAGIPGLFGRLTWASAGVMDAYAAFAYPDGKAELYSVVAGSFSLIGSAVAGTVANGDTFRLEMVGTGIVVLVNAVSKISVTDSAVTATGTGALRMFSQDATAGWTNFALYDDAGGGGGFDPVDFVPGMVQTTPFGRRRPQGVSYLAPRLSLTDIRRYGKAA